MSKAYVWLLKNSVEGPNVGSSYIKPHFNYFEVPGLFSFYDGRSAMVHIILSSFITQCKSK